MPILGFGVWRVPGPAVMGPVKAALDTGYRHIDSAIMYRNEEELGKVVRDSGIKRDELFITSKVGSRYHGSQSASKAIEQSLQRFQLGYLDLFLIHDPLSGKRKRLDTWRVLIQKRDEGKLRSIGVSNYGVRHLEEIREAGLELPAVNQIELHPWCQQRPIVDYCKNNGIVVQAYCPLTQGVYLNEPILAELSKKYNKDHAQILIRWSLQMGYSPLPKSEKPSRILSNSQVYDFQLSEEDMKALNALDLGADGATSWNPVNVA